MSGLDMVREIIGQINNLRKLVTVNGKQYKYDQKSKSYKADGRTFTPSELKAKLEGQSYTAPKIDNKSKLKVKPKLKRTGKLYPGGISRPDKGRYGRNLPSKDKYGVPSQKKRLLKPKTTPTPKNTPEKTKTNKTKVKQKTQYKRTGKPPVQIKPKKLIKTGTKFLKRIRNIPGAGTFGRGVSRAGGIAGGIGMGLGLADNLVDHAREVTNVVQRIRNKPFKTFGATGYEKKLIEKSEERRKKKNTNNNNKVKINKKDKNTNTDKKETAYDKLRSGKPTGLANLPKNDGRVVVKGRGGKATRVNPDYGVKGQPDKVVNENKRTSKIKDKKSTNKKRLTARERLRAKNREIHGKAADKVYDYNKAWQKARREGRLEEFKKKNKARRHWQ